MQKLTILTHHTESPKKRLTARFNIGQKVILIEWQDGNPYIIESYILFVGISSEFQTDDLQYIVSRQYRNGDLLPIYEKQLFATVPEALKSLNRHFRKRMKQLKSLSKTSYYDEIEVNGRKF